MEPDRPVAVIIPTDEEFAPYRQLLPDLQRLDGGGPWELHGARAGARPLVLILSDAGPVNVAAATERVLMHCAPAAVLHGGSAGAHHAGLLPGDVVLGARYVIHTTRSVRAARVARGLLPSLLRFRRDGVRYSFDAIDGDPDLLLRGESVVKRELDAMGPWPAPGWPASAPPRSGKVVTGVIASADAWTVDAEEIAALREDFGAECEDMESAYVAQVCALHRVPFLAVRAISNNEAACPLAPAGVLPAITAAGERAARIITALASEL